MASTRHSPALFEVINRDKPLDQQRRKGFFAGIARWFAPRIRSELAAVQLSAEPAADTAAPAAAPAASIVAETQQPLLVDQDQREIHLRLTFASAFIAGLAMLTLLAVAFMIGQRFAPNRGSLTATAIDARTGQRPQPSVLKLGTPPRTAIDAGLTVRAEAPLNDAGTTGGAGLPPPAPRTRTAGLNYMIIQSYPDQKTANDAMAILVQNGVECTVEKALPGWGTNTWYSVVGLDGFSRISSNPAYDAYGRKIREISEKFAKKGSFKAFDPKPYRWGRTN